MTETIEKMKKVVGISTSTFKDRIEHMTEYISCFALADVCYNVMIY